MTKRMLIDATHAEETRVVVLDGNRLEDFDVETSTKRQLKGNIYLAKVVRVEPSLQAAFVEYGGGRHGFLAFSEIHPDYYQIPVADRQRLLDMEAEEARREEEEADRELEVSERGSRGSWAPAAPAAEMIPAETGGTALRQDEATPERQSQAPNTAAAPAAAAAEAAETGDESGTTVGMLHDADDSLAGAGRAAPSTAQAAEAETGDESGAVVNVPQGADDSLAGAAMPAASTGAAHDPASELPAARSEQLGVAVAGGMAGTPVDAVSESASPSSDAPAAETVSASGGTPSLSTADSGSDAVSPALDSPEIGSAATPPESDEEPTPPSRRAQPMIIESETVSGPADIDDETDTSAAEPVAIASDAILEADTEETADFATDHDVIPEAPPPETVGGEPDSADEQRERRLPSRYLRNYKIQEVIRRRQILLVQVVKEERGTKGAALTTYLSLAGRFCVLMPNSPRGGGISRKITSAADRRRLKEIIQELDMPKGMGLIVRTAGANRPKPEIKRDCEYLLRLWDEIREHTMKSVASALIYEEASLIKRAIRDVYSRDIDEIQVDGEEGWKAAHEFMRMLMPSHAKKVQLWRDPSQPLFAKYAVEAQLDAMLQPTVQLRSGGYLVINQAEALVAIDVNSGRATRERNVEEMALRTNLEAADEVARQLRLRDLAGLIVIDFIDMESKKHNAMVERRIKEALKNDHARIQVGHISHFGLLEMSRQRLRPSLAETSFILCPHCGGTGHVRSTESAAIHVLRGIEDEGSKHRSAEIVVHVATPTALYILNHKRERLREIEIRYAMRVTVLGDDTQVASQYRIDRVRQQAAREGMPAVITPDAPQPVLPAPRPDIEPADEGTNEEAADSDEAGADETESGEEMQPAGAEGTDERGDQAERRRRRRRRRGPRREDAAASPAAEGEPPLVTDLPESEAAAAAPQAESEERTIEQELAVEAHIEGVPEHAEATAEDDGRRRRGRRGGRRRRREGETDIPAAALPDAEQPELPPVYSGPTPANPFGGQAFDIFDVLEQAEAQAAQRRDVEPAARSTSPRSEAAVVTPEPWQTATPDAPGALAPDVSEEPAPSADADAGAMARPVVPDIVNSGGPEPAPAQSLTQTVTPSSPEPDGADPASPAAPDVANDAAAEPAIRPIMVGSDDEVVEKKRGWWRR